MLDAKLNLSFLLLLLLLLLLLFTSDGKCNAGSIDTALVKIVDACYCVCCSVCIIASPLGTQTAVVPVERKRSTRNHLIKRRYTL